MAPIRVRILEVFPAHEPPPLPPFGHPLPRGGGEGRGEGAVGRFKGARRVRSSGSSLLRERGRGERFLQSHFRIGRRTTNPPRYLSGCSLRFASTFARPRNCFQRLGLTPSSRAGRKRIALSSANTAATVMPINRNGRQINQRNGYSTSTATASGQENTNRMLHATSAKKRRMTYVIVQPRGNFNL